MEPGAIVLPPPTLWAFFAVAVGLTLCLAVAEVVAAFRETTYSPWRSVVNGWAFPLYAFYALLTLILGVVLFENEILPRTWTAAVVLGLAGPALFRTRIKLFQPISGEGGPAANLERVMTGVQTFSFNQIKRHLARQRMASKERAARQDEGLLTARLRALSTPEEMARLQPLIEERRRSDPESVRAFLVALIEARHPGGLEQPFAGGEAHPPP